MGSEGGRLTSIGIAGLVICLIELPFAALGHGEAGADLADRASFGTTVSQPVGSAAAARAQAIMLAQASAVNQVVPADQLNDIDRALNNDAFRSRTAGVATTPMRRVAPVIVAATDSSIWDETSLVGKVFVVLGALLTIASAARMFMA